MTEMWLECESFGGTLSEKGRVPVILKGGKKYSVERERVSKVKWDGEKFYLWYSTTHPEFYHQYSGQPPEWAIEVELETRKVLTGDRCDCGRYWDADIIFEMEEADGAAECPECGAILHTHTVTKVMPKTDQRKLADSIAQYVARQRGLKITQALGPYYRTMAGGYTISSDKEQEVLQVSEMRVSLLTNVHIIETHYDDDRVYEHGNFQGAFIKVEYHTRDALERILYKVE